MVGAMADSGKLLAIEEALRNRSGSSESGRFGYYETLKHALLNNEYLFTLHSFPGGNDHGPKHIIRVLEYVDKLLANDIEKLSELELYLLLCSVVLHDQGLLHGRAGHSRASQKLLKLPDFSGLFEDHEVEFLGKIVAVHSAREDIVKEFQSFDDVEHVAGDSVRLKYLAALLRLADELDEDSRRAKSRVFQKLHLPEESVIYWLINMHILSIKPLLASKSIKVTVQYATDEIEELYPYESGRLVNVLAGVFRKIQKVNAEREYCMRFIDDGPLLRKVKVRFRNTVAKRNLDVTLDDAFNGDEFFAAHPDLFLEEVTKAEPEGDRQPDDPASEDIPDIPKLETGVRLWEDLSDAERDSVRRVREEFLADALAVTSRPELYGRWETRITDPPEEGLVTLRVRLFPERNAVEPIRINVFQVGPYPENPPQIEVHESDAHRVEQALVAKLKLFCAADPWRSQYRRLQTNRLVHLADSINSLQSAYARFRQDAAEIVQGTDSRWQLEMTDRNGAYLKSRANSFAGGYCVSVEKVPRYPLARPKVRCDPVPSSPVWLGTGELNWSDRETDDERPKWKRMLQAANPLATLTEVLENLFEEPDRS